jgi:hypothetical protein
MKFSHAKLEQIRKAPKDFKNILGEKGQGTMSINRLWQFAVRHYHQKKNDKNYAIMYFEDKCERFVANAINRAKIDNHLSKLEKYIKSYNKLGYDYYDYSNRLSFDIGFDNFISGEIFRIDKKPDEGYAITLLWKDEENLWNDQLRFPVFQINYSDLFKCPVDAISVGVYDFNKEKHEYKTFDDYELKNAKKEIISISKIIAHK